MEKKKCKHCQLGIDKKAKKCPKCSGDLRNWFRRHPILTLILILIGIKSQLWLDSSIIDKLDGSTNTPQGPEAISKDKLNEFAKLYCDNHEDTLHLPDFTSDGMPPIHKKDLYSRKYEGGSNLTLEDCKGVVNRMLDSYPIDEVENITEAKIWNGMTPSQALLSVGYPNDVNDTVSANFVHEQWVYGTGIDNSYLYFEGASKDERKLTTWQDW